ncbi:MAG: hypothetical protein JWO59_1588 [Chloroflexi bacterium]|nr:hypothetical protein [Chloroflexota bacterium]MDB5075200.1 hypothetical protein [Chloroflexota bacterium]
MAQIRVEAKREVAADPARVFKSIADYGPGRLKWLPENYSELVDERGRKGSDTLVRYRLKVGPREREYHMRILEAVPGSTVVETDTASSMTVTWHVAPRDSGSEVKVISQWSGSGGIGGFFERRFAPSGLKKVLDQALAGLASSVSG